jgi:3-deoxy-D-manno-octulosonate 8-phosphate phosphatase (KDO 8-P phosphatase)
MISAELKERLRRIKLLISDVDGVFTDGSLYLGSDGTEYKQFNVLDGAGVALLRATGIPLAIISGRESAVTTRRMQELGLEENLYQGQLAKLEPYEKIKAKYQLDDSEILYIGDDLPDLPLIRKAGIGVAVANSLAEMKEQADYITLNTGGHGAVREVIELLLKIQGKFEDALLKMNINSDEDF